jgi:hypothetical protein
MINSLRLRSPAFASPALSTREERADKKGEESEGYVTYREQTEGWSLKINMVDPRQNLFGRVSQFCETDTVQSIVEQKHLVSATERGRVKTEKPREEEVRLGDLSHSHGELFVAHSVNSVHCVGDRFSLCIFKMLFVLLLDVFREALGR